MKRGKPILRKGPKIFFVYLTGIRNSSKNYQKRLRHSLLFFAVLPPNERAIAAMQSSCGSGALLLPLGSEVGEVLALFLISLEGSRRVKPRQRAVKL
jgi:hypothetical protein